MRDHLDAHVAARFLSRFGLAVGLNEILWIEREILSDSYSCRHVGVQEARESGAGYEGHRERHIYALAAGGVSILAIWDPESRRLVSVVPPTWTVVLTRAHDGRTSRKDPRDDVYMRERRHRGRRVARRVAAGVGGPGEGAVEGRQRG
jgi:hypothetical protein